MIILPGINHHLKKKIKKIIFCLFIFTALYSLTLVTDRVANAQGKDNEDANLLKVDRNLEEVLKTKVNAKAVEYEKKNFSQDQITINQKKIHDEYNLEKEKKEKEFNLEYDRLLDYLYRLSAIKVNLQIINEEIDSRIAQINGLTRWITTGENILEIHEHNLKQRLQSIPNYFLLLGKAAARTKLKKENLQQIIDDMKEFLKDQELQVELNPGNKFPLTTMPMDEESIVPDGREYCEVKNGTIYVYKVFRFYPFAIKKDNEKHILKTLYRYFFTADDAVEVTGFKIKLGENDADTIKCIDFNYGPDALGIMMDFFDYRTKDMEGFPGISLIADLKETYIKDLEKINLGLEAYRKKSGSISQDISDKKNELKGNSRTLENLNGKLKTGINDLSEFAKDMRQGPVSIDKIKEMKNNIDTSIKALLGNLAKGEDFQNQLQAIDTGFQDIFSTLEKFNQELNQAEKKLMEGREAIFLVCGESGEVHGENVPGNFMDAANHALDLIWEEMLRTNLGIARLDANGNIDTLAGDKFYRQGKIADLDVPLVYRTGPGTGDQDSRYMVYLKARIVCQSAEIPIIKDYVETIKDPLYNITWTKDIGKPLVYDGSAAVTVVSRLEKLNRDLTDKERRSQPWSLVTKSDLEKLLNRKDMWEELNIRLNRNYWTSERAGIYYRCYKFQEKAKGELELLQEKLVSSDGAYCIFVRKAE